MISKQIIPVIGLKVTVYGLDEYNLLPKNTPVSVMFALHGRLQNQSKMEPIAQLLCRLNEQRKGSDRHLLVVTFDSPNHGSRLHHKLANFAWIEGKHRNPNHALDMWSMVTSTANSVSELIDVLEHYMFGPREEKIVQVWGVLGFSMGGHAAFIAAANDPRITVSVPIVGISDYISLMQSRLAESNLSEEKYFPKHFQKLVSDKVANLDEKLKSKHILILNAEKDQLVKAKFNEPLIQNLRKTHLGRESYDWRYYIVPGVGHEWCSEMEKLSADWAYQWMIRNINSSKL